MRLCCCSGATICLSLYNHYYPLSWILRHLSRLLSAFKGMPLIYSLVMRMDYLTTFRNVFWTAPPGRTEGALTFLKIQTGIHTPVCIFFTLFKVALILTIIFFEQITRNGVFACIYSWIIWTLTISPLVAKWHERIPLVGRKGPSRFFKTIKWYTHFTL